MLNIPEKTRKSYVDAFKRQKVSENELSFYLKWLRYYLDFCHKYSHEQSSSDSLSLFTRKLKQKNQTEKQIIQAKKAIQLFYQMSQSYQSKSSHGMTQRKVSSGKITYSSTIKPDLSKNQTWENEFKLLKNEIKIRQYSIQTLKTYKMWLRKFQSYHKSKSPQLLESKDAKKFITHLAVHPMR